MYDRKPHGAGPAAASAPPERFRRATIQRAPAGDVPVRVRTGPRACAGSADVVHLRSPGRKRRSRAYAGQKDGFFLTRGAKWMIALVLLAALCGAAQYFGLSAQLAQAADSVRKSLQPSERLQEVWEK